MARNDFSIASLNQGCSACSRITARGNHDLMTHTTFKLSMRSHRFQMLSFKAHIVNLKTQFKCEKCQRSACIFAREKFKPKYWTKMSLLKMTTAQHREQSFELTDSFNSFPSHTNFDFQNYLQKTTLFKCTHQKRLLLASFQIFNPKVSGLSL